MSHLLRISEVITLFGVSRYIVERAVYTGKLKSIRFGENGWNWFKLQDCIEAFGNPKNNNLEENNYMGKITNTLFVKRFLELLITPFTNWQQYKNGVIDAQGQVLVSHADFKKAFSDPLFKIVRKLKMLLIRFGIKDNKSALSLISLYLLKEDTLSNTLSNSESKKFLTELQEIENNNLESDEAELLERFKNEIAITATKILKESVPEMFPKPIIVESDDEEYDEEEEKNTFKQIFLKMAIEEENKNG